MKLTIKIALIISLFCTTAFAGEMGEGGFVCGEMGEGGIIIPCDNTTSTEILDDKSDKDFQDDFLIFVKDFLGQLFG